MSGLLINVACLVRLSKKVFGHHANYVTKVSDILKIYWSRGQSSMSSKCLNPLPRWTTHKTDWHNGWQVVNRQQTDKTCRQETSQTDRQNRTDREDRTESRHADRTQDRETKQNGQRRQDRDKACRQDTRQTDKITPI